MAANSKIQSKYIYGTEAPAYSYERTAKSAAKYNVYEENKVLKAKMAQKQERAARLRIALVMFAAFILAMTIIYRYTLITDMTYKINKAEKLYEQLRSENSSIAVKIEKATDLAYIRDEAESRLGMQMPDKSQIVYISIPKKDFTVVARNDGDLSNGFGQPGGTNGFAAVLLDGIGELLSLIY